MPHEARSDARVLRIPLGAEENFETVKQMGWNRNVISWRNCVNSHKQSATLGQWMWA